MPGAGAVFKTELPTCNDVGHSLWWYDQWVSHSLIMVIGVRCWFWHSWCLSLTCVCPSTQPSGPCTRQQLHSPHAVMLCGAVAGWRLPGCSIVPAGAEAPRLAHCLAAASTRPQKQRQPNCQFAGITVHLAGYATQQLRGTTRMKHPAACCSLDIPPVEQAVNFCSCPLSPASC